MSRSYNETKNAGNHDALRRDKRGPRHGKAGYNFDMAADHPAAIEGRTRYPHSLREGDPMPLKSGEHSTKLGKRVTKGKWAGMHIYGLTLEERDTCPRSCSHWLDCFGNKMLWAIRHAPGPALESNLFDQLLSLSLQWPHGFVVRLHVLGDFYSVAYAEFWEKCVQRFPGMRVFGYTAWPASSAIGAVVYRTMMANRDRFAMRWSDAKWQQDNTVSINTEADAPAGVIVCPQQTGKTSCCGTCALCWETRKPIGFISH